MTPSHTHRPIAFLHFQLLRPGTESRNRGFLMRDDILMLLARSFASATVFTFTSLIDFRRACQRAVHARSQSIMLVPIPQWVVGS